MDAKLNAKLLAALDAAEAMFREIENPTMNIRDQWSFCREQMKAVKAGRKALERAE